MSPRPVISTVPTMTGPMLFEFNDYTQRVIVAVVICLVFVVGLVGNSLVILAVLLSRKLQSSTNWFVVNLAFADLLLCLCLPFQVVAMVSRGGWPLPGWICAVDSATIFICLGASVMSLAFIAYNRWYLLTQPKAKFQKLYTTRNIGLMVIVSWLYPFVLVVVPHFAGLGRLGYSKEYKSCTQDTSLPTSEYYSLLAGVAAIIPVFLVIVIIYARIYRFVTKQMKYMATLKQSAVISRSGNPGATIEMPASKITPESSSSATTDPSNKSQTTLNSDLDSSSHPDIAAVVEEFESDSPDIESSSRISPTDAKPNVEVRPQKSGQQNPTVFTVEIDTSKRRKPGQQLMAAKTTPSTIDRQHVRVTKRLAIVVLAFFLCLLPFGVSALIPQSDPGIPWTGLILTFNSCVNPLIYARTQPVFREVMGCIVHCSFDSIPQPVRCIRRR